MSENISADANTSLNQNSYVNKENSSLITYSDFNRICRTCMSKQDLNLISDVAYEEIEVAELLETCASIKVDLADSMPLNICSTCLFELIKSYIFRQKCQDTEKLLLQVKNSYVNKVELSSKHNEDKKNGDVLDSFTVNNILIKSDEDSICSFNEVCKIDDDRNVGKLENITISDRVKRKKIKKGANNRSNIKQPCTVCSKEFTASKMRQHMRTHTKEKPYKCKVCYQRFSMSGNLKRHSMTHTGERPHICNICNKGFIQSTSLTAHMKTHSEDEIFRSDGCRFYCDHCGKYFKRLARYNAHMKKHEGGYVREESKDEVEALKEYICEICKRSYKTRNLLRAHRLTHGEKSFLCSDCGKGFVTKAALQSHMKVHTGEKPYSCNLCYKSFAHAGSYDAHMLTHRGYKPYTCKVCMKSFTQTSHLKYHLRTHNGERPYVCNYCDKRFALKGNLKVHVRIHTGETPYVCNICKKGFYDSSSLKKHKKNHTTGECVDGVKIEITALEASNNSKTDSIESFSKEEKIDIQICKEEPTLQLLNNAF